jgi:glycine/D-amino acid oxidase-like deaminating enzyme
LTIHPPSSYPRYLEPCGWQSLLVRRCPEPALAEATECDLAVVGAGYTGLAAARTWAGARPQDRVVVLDASVVGEGSPGRNSGFMLEIALADDADAAAVDRMARCNRLLAETMTTLRDLVRRNDIDCQLERVGTYRGAATARGVAYLERYRAFLDAAGLHYERLDADDLEARLGTRYYRYGLFSPDCSLVQPAALIRGLADALPHNVQLYEETPAVGLTRRAEGWQIDCPNGNVLARRVLLANNAFARDLAAGARGGGGSRLVAGLGLDAGLRSRLTAMYTYAGMTGPLPESDLAMLGSVSNWGLLPAHRLGTTLRRTADGRLLVRSFYGYEREEDNDRVAAGLEDCLLRRFPHLTPQGAGERRFEHVWGGATGFTYNGAPVWGEIAPGLLVSAGCNGGGVVKGTLLGTLLARKALGERVPDVAGLFGAASWMPPEPVRRIGFALISRAARRSAGLET